MRDAETQYLRGGHTSDAIGTYTGSDNILAETTTLVYGSHVESMLYASNIKKAKQKVNGDIIVKIGLLSGGFWKIL